MTGLRRDGPAARFAAVFTAVVIFLSAGAGEAFGVVGGKTVSITAAPWSVVVWARSPYAGMPRYAACTGVIIDARHILTAEHCVMRGGTAQSNPASHFTIEAGVSNFKHPLASDHPQMRTVSAERLMPGYIALSREIWETRQMPRVMILRYSRCRVRLIWVALRSERRTFPAPMRLSRQPPRGW